MTLQVSLTPRAAREIRAITAWWRENRAAAPHLFEKELDAVVEWLAAFPGGGQVFEVPDGRSVRRAVLRRSRYYLYYEVDDGGGELRVLSVWHTARRAAKFG